MPEGHTIHRLASDHEGRFGGRVVRASSPQGKFAAGAALVDGQVMEDAEAHGKHLFLGFGPAGWIHIHLGLFGKYALGPGLPPPPTDTVRLRLTGQDGYADLRGPTACELITDAEKQALHDRLGPDPLRPGTDPKPAWLRISRSRMSIAGLLMDQKVVAGVGNVYRAEVLFRHGIDPYRPGREVGLAAWQAIWADLVALMREGVRLQPHRHRAPRAHPAGHGTPATGGRPRRRGLRLPARRPAVPGVRHPGAHRGAGQTQPVLVPGLSEAVRQPGFDSTAEGR